MEKNMYSSIEHKASYVVVNFGYGQYLALWPFQGLISIQPYVRNG